MDRYYTILVETLKQLGRNDRAMRDAVYRRAREELDRMLDQNDTPVPITQRIAQKSELEQAIARLEGEIAAARAPQVATTTPAPPPLPPHPSAPRLEPAPVADARPAPADTAPPAVSDHAELTPWPAPTLDGWETERPAPEWPSDLPEQTAVEPANRRGTREGSPEGPSEGPFEGTGRRRLSVSLPGLRGLLRRDRRTDTPPGPTADAAPAGPVRERRGPADIPAIGPEIVPEIVDGGLRTPLPAQQGRDVNEILSARGRSRRRVLIAGATGAVVVVGAAAYWTFAGSSGDPMQGLADTVIPLFTGDDPSVLTPIGGETVAALNGQPAVRVVSAQAASGPDIRTVGVLVDVPSDLRAQVHNRFLRVTAVARRAADNGADAFAIAYSTVTAGASGWKEFGLDDDFRAFEFVYLRSSDPGDPAPDAIVIRADPSGDGGGIDLRFVGIEILA